MRAGFELQNEKLIYKIKNDEFNSVCGLATDKIK